jgi:phospho-N-acetylmuramoyl-pentapeptide-transferase
MTDVNPTLIHGLTSMMGFGLIACIISLVWAPALIRVLRAAGITRKKEGDATMAIESRAGKADTPIMGGLLVIVTVAVLTFAFDWDRRFTWVPVGVMVFSALLGALDDLLNVFGSERRQRSLAQTMTLICVHKNLVTRFWLVITLPWTWFKRATTIFGSKQRKGLLVHEKLLLQFAAGAVAAWWIYLKLGDAWQDIYIPFLGFGSIGIWIIPVIILVVMFTANAVNISDGMDGLAGGMLIPTFGALAFLSFIQGLEPLAILNSITAGSLVAYTFFNIKPARFQMGDVGSLGLGGLLAINALAVNGIILLPFIAFMFYAEALSVIVQAVSRHLFGRRVFRMAPLHHHLELRGWSEEKTIMRLWIVHLAAVVMGLWLGLH